MLVIIPGFGSSRNDYDIYKRLFVEVTIIRFTTEITLEEHLETIESYISLIYNQEEDLEIHLLGFSWGGILAQLYSSKYPDRITSQIVVGAGRELLPPRSLNLIFKNGYLFYLVSLGIFLASYPFLMFFASNTFRQRFGGFKIIKRLGLKHTYNLFNNAFQNSIQLYRGQTPILPTTYINLQDDVMVPPLDLESVSNLPQIRMVELQVSDPSHIHVTQELEEKISQLVKILLEAETYKGSLNLQS